MNLVRSPQMHNRRRSRGFSLLELSVAMTIVMVLAAISITSTKYMRDRARMSIYYSTIHDVKSAVIRFQHDMGFFPPDVGKGVDPALISRDGFMQGNHSSAWESADLSNWNGPYLAYKKWPQNPWGGELEYDYYPEGYDYGGVDRAGIYLTSKAAAGGGHSGMPHIEYEKSLQSSGVDKSRILGIVSLWVNNLESAAVAK